MNKNLHKSFIKNGFCVIDIFKKNDLEKIKSLLAKKINSKLIEKKKFFNKKNLHSFHKKSLNPLSIDKILNSKKRNIVLGKEIIKKLENKNLNYFLKQLWGHNQKKIVWVGNPKFKEIEFNKAGYRIFAPSKNKKFKKKGNGYPHIDAYNLKDNHFVTLWVPMVGFSEKYTMLIAPKSHKTLHNKNNFIKKKNYISRIFANNYSNKFQFVRPRLSQGQAIIHHPNVIHSGGMNIGKKTRISIEIRLFDKKKFNLKKSFNPRLY